MDRELTWTATIEMLWRAVDLFFETHKQLGYFTWLLQTTNGDVTRGSE